jgi:hypothetical protein
MPETNLYNASGRNLAKIVSDDSVSRIYDRSGNYIGRFEKSSGLIFDKNGKVAAKATGDLSGVVALLVSL